MTYQDIVEKLLADVGASRTTIRVDRPDAVFPVVAEATAPGINSIAGATSIDLKAAPTFIFLAEQKRPALRPAGGPVSRGGPGTPPAFYVLGNLLGEGFAGIGAPVPELDWGYWSEPLPGGRRIHLKRGRLVGGTSMINGGIFVRGKPSDFAEWVELGAAGWSWEEVRPFYEKVESEVTVKPYPREQWQPFARVFEEAFAELGHRVV